jgi:hypothetical protein
MRLFLGAHRARLAFVGIEQPRPWSIVPPSSMISIWRRASALTASPMKRIELTFLISQRVPSGAPGFLTDTFTSARSDPFSMSPSQVPR